jgi:hypothetical protein
MWSHTDVVWVWELSPSPDYFRCNSVCDSFRLVQGTDVRSIQWSGLLYRILISIGTALGLPPVPSPRFDGTRRTGTVPVPLEIFLVPARPVETQPARPSDGFTSYHSQKR